MANESPHAKLDGNGFPYSDDCVYKIVETESVTVSGTSTQSAVIDKSRIVELCSTTDCHIVIGSNPTATSSDFFLPANTYRKVLVVEDTDKIAVIQNSAGGNLFITELE